MLPKKNRLSKKEIFLLKKENPKIIQGELFGLSYLPKENEQKFGLIISTKIAKKAVERNRIKRALFLAIEKNLIGNCGWFLFLAKKTCVAADTTLLKAETDFFAFVPKHLGYFVYGMLRLGDRHAVARNNHDMFCRQQ